MTNGTNGTNGTAPKIPRKEKLMKSKARLNHEQLAELLESIAERVRAGSLTLGDGPNAVAMDLPEGFRVSMEVEDFANRDRTRITRELEIEIEWPVDAEGAPIVEPGPASGFTVS